MNFIDALGNSFERLLRWLYPGILVLVLLFLSKPNLWESYREFLNSNETIGLWGLLFLIIVSGMTAYTMQAYIVNNIVSLIYFILGFTYKDDEQLPKITRRWAECAHKWGETARRRWGIIDINGIREDRERLGRWLDYSWGTYHVGCMTVWLYWIFYSTSDVHDLTPFLVPPAS